jgi:ketosteroid isomerase-like protein
VRTVLFAAVTLICAPLHAQASDNTLRSELEALHAKWFHAFDTGDGATMDAMEVENLVLVMPNGMVWPKDGARAGKQPKQNPVPQRTLTDVTVRQFGDVAILTGAVVSTTPTDKNRDATTVVFTRQSGQWRIASAQWTTVAASK